jgi:allophanate hydrolase
MLADRVAAAYRRIQAESPPYTWITLAPFDDVMRRARQLDDTGRLPLKGRLFGVKDNIDVAGLPTTVACPAYAYTPACSAPVVDRLEAAGAIVVGKTNLDQFATGLVGTRSPYGACSSVFDADYVSGGSSSGSAVAVAAGLVDFALATDTAGSGRVPAAFNGIVGLKPTCGLLSTRGVVPACRSADCVSILARTTSTAREVWEVAQGFDAQEPFSRHAVSAPAAVHGTQPPFRFGVPSGDHPYIDDPLFIAVAERLTRLGGSCVGIDFGPFLEAGGLLYGPWVAERFADLGDFLQVNVAEVNPVVYDIIVGGSKYSAADLFHAQHRLKALRRQAEATFASIDVLLVPTTPRHPTHAEVERDPVRTNAALGYYTTFANLLDLAALALPAGVRANGLPFGISLIGPAFSDAGLLALAERLNGPPRDAARVEKSQAKKAAG